MSASQIKIAEDLTLSRIIPGMMRLNNWGMNPQGLLGWIDAVMNMGITSFDHADIYGDYTCEQHFGDALALNPSLRNDIQIITKCNIQLVSQNRPKHNVHMYNTSKEHIIASAENSLRNFHTYWIDLLLIHRFDPLMNVDEVAEAFTVLRDAGKVLYFGVSNFLPHQFDLLQSRLGFPLVTNQIEFSVAHLAPLFDGILDQCQERKISPMAWSPLAGGRIFQTDTGQGIRLNLMLKEVADEVGASVDQVALAWILKHPVRILPVLGTGKLERIQKAVDAERIVLTREQWFKILEASQGHEVP